MQVGFFQAHHLQQCICSLRHLTSLWTQLIRALLGSHCLLSSSSDYEVQCRFWENQTDHVGEGSQTWVCCHGSQRARKSRTHGDAGHQRKWGGYGAHPPGNQTGSCVWLCAEAGWHAAFNLVCYVPYSSWIRSPSVPRTGEGTDTHFLSLFVFPCQFFQAISEVAMNWLTSCPHLTEQPDWWGTSDFMCHVLMVKADSELIKKLREFKSWLSK